MKSARAKLYVALGVLAAVVAACIVAACVFLRQPTVYVRAAAATHDDAFGTDHASAAELVDDDGDGAEDPMLKAAVEVVIDAGQASTSLLQRRCKLGYARAARIMDEMEQKGIIGPYEGAKPRAVLISRQQWLEMCMNAPDDTP